MSEGSPGRLKPDLSSETIRPESQWDDIVKVRKEGKLSTKNLIYI